MSGEYFYVRATPKKEHVGKAVGGSWVYGPFDRVGDTSLFLETARRECPEYDWFWGEMRTVEWILPPPAIVTGSWKFKHPGKVGD
jgi:hypothetical protein